MTLPYSESHRLAGLKHGLEFLRVNTVHMNSTKVQNPRRNSYAGTGCRHLHQYTTALSVTHARISLPHASNQQRSLRKDAENEPVSRIKMADNRALVSIGTL